MGQLGFFDADRRLSALSAKGDPLEAIAALVPWESFRADIEAVVLTPEAEKKSSAGRKPIDAMVMFRMLVLQSLYNLSDEQIEYQVRDRLSFTRFLGLGFEDGIPDGTTLWLFREKLAKAGLIDRAVRAFRPASGSQGLHRARRADGRCDDRAGAAAAQQPRRERARSRPARRPRIGRRNRRRTGRRTRTRAGRRSMASSFFGYKNHVNADARHKLIRDYDGDRCERCTTAACSTSFWTRPTPQGRVRRQRLPLGRDGAEA